MNCLGVFDHFVGMALKGLNRLMENLLKKNNEFKDFVAFILRHQTLYSLLEDIT